MGEDALRFPFTGQGTPDHKIVGPAIASAATISVTHQIHEITGTTQITSINLPYAGFAGRITLIFTNANPGGVGTGGTAGIDIAAAHDPSQNKFLDLVYHPELAKWYVEDDTAA